MLVQNWAGWFGKAFPDPKIAPTSSPEPIATIAELNALNLMAPPCCSHIALCDGTCNDAQADLSSARGDTVIRKGDQCS